MDFNNLYHLLGLGGLLGSAAIWVVGLYLTGRERRISLAGEALAGALTTLLVPLYMAISGGRLALWLALPLGCLGLAAGALRGFTLPLRVVDGGQIVGRQSRLLLLFWGGALLLQQLATFSGSAALSTLKPAAAPRTETKSFQRLIVPFLVEPHFQQPARPPVE